MSKRLLILAALPFLGGMGAHHFQQATDPGRWSQADEMRAVFVPSPVATKVASMGFNMVVADLLWIRAVLLFVDFLDSDSDDGAHWTRTVLKTVGTLDPAWRTPFFYGGGMLRLLDNIEGSDEIFSDGMKAFPQDAYFPFSLAMNAYLHHEDLEMAVKYLQQAATMPGAPLAYRHPGDTPEKHLTPLPFVLVSVTGWGEVTDMIVTSPHRIGLVTSPPPIGLGQRDWMG